MGITQEFLLFAVGAIWGAAVTVALVAAAQLLDRYRLPAARLPAARPSPLPEASETLMLDTIIRQKSSEK